MKCKCGSDKFFIKTIDYSDSFDASKLNEETLIEKLQSGDWHVDFCNSDVSVRCKECDHIIYE